MPQPDTVVVTNTSRKILCQKKEITKISNPKCHSNMQEKALSKLNKIIKDTK